MLVVKLSDEDAAALGVRHPDDAVAKLKEAAGMDELLKQADKEAASMKETITALEARLKAVEEKIGAIVPAAAIAAEDRASILKEARDLASKDFHAFVAKIGTVSLPQSAGVESEAVQARLVAPDDYKGQWENDENLKAEFASWEVYAAFKAAMDSGRVRIK